MKPRKVNKEFHEELTKAIQRYASFPIAFVPEMMYDYQCIGEVKFIEIKYVIHMAWHIKSISSKDHYYGLWTYSKGASKWNTNWSMDDTALYDNFPKYLEK